MGALFISFFAETAYSQAQQNLVTIAGGVSSERLGAFSNHFSYGFSVFLSPTGSARIGLSGQYSNPSVDYDFIGVTHTEHLRMSSYQLLFAVPFLRFDGDIKVEAIGGGGITTLSTPEHAISAGGAGLLRVPARSERLNIYSLGLVANKNFSSRISASVSPRVVFMSPVQISSAGFSIEGGISIGFF